MGDAQGESNKPTYENFLQQVSAAWESNGTLRARLGFDLKQSIKGNPNPFSSKDVILSNGNMEIYFNHAKPPGSDWTSFRVPLNPSGWLNSATEELVTEEEMNAVLSQLNKLWIRGEFQTGDDSGGIDNISIR